MEARELHRGRLIDHIQLVVTDIDASRRFYAAIFGVLAIPIAGNAPDHIWADELFISTAECEAAQGRLTGHHHLAFQAQGRAMVDRFYDVGLQHGGTDNGPPGVRNYHAEYYAAFLLDPDGNNIEAVFQGPARRSAASVKVNF